MDEPVKVNPCCRKALETLDHSWVVWEGSSFIQCSICIDDAVDKAVKENRDVIPAHEHRCFYVDTIKCVWCGRFYPSSRESDCKCGHKTKPIL
jgi:hypothetical protein